MTTTKQKPAELIGEYVRLRDLKREAEAEYAEFRRVEYDAPMNLIENQLLEIFNDLGSDSIKTKEGTAYKKMSTSVTTADGSEFRRHVIGLEAWDLINFIPNKTAINDLVAAGEPLPPGINRTAFYNITINRPKETQS